MRISDWSSDVCSSDLFDPQRVLPLFNFLLTRPTMKKPFAIIAIALSALGAVAAAQAGEETYVPPSFSTLSRSQVLAALASAPALPDTAETYVPASFSTLRHPRVQATLPARRAAGPPAPTPRA